jgi:hypothetical protein
MIYKVHENLTPFCHAPNFGINIFGKVLKMAVGDEMHELVIKFN